MSRARYGVDAPPVLIGLVSGTVLMIPGTIVTAVFAGWWALWPAAVLVYLAAASAFFLHTTRRGKFAVWEDVLDGLELRGDEKVLDLGCGRGAVLIAVAKRLPSGHVTGADLWRSVDQSGNAPEVTRANADVEGVADRISLDTADVTALPYPDESFDLVVSSMVVHNIRSAAARFTALDEALRVLRTGGQLVIADIGAVKSYPAHLAERGLAPVLRPLGRRMWWGGPWLPTSLVTAVRTG